MRDTVRDVRGGSKRVHGHVSAAGVVMRGVGFLASRVSAGRYLITFLEPYSAPPDSTVTVTDNVGYTVIANSPSEKNLTVYIAAVGGALTDQDFEFSSEGPVR